MFALRTPLAIALALSAIVIVCILVYLVYRNIKRVPPPPYDIVEEAEQIARNKSVSADVAEYYRTRAKNVKRVDVNENGSYVTWKDE